MGPSCARAASKPRMTLSASRICCSRPRAALALQWGATVSYLSHTPCALQTPPPEHALLPVEAAQSPHVVALILDIVEDHGQLQGRWAHRLRRQKGLTLLLGCFLFGSQALKVLCRGLGQGGSGRGTQLEIPGSPDLKRVLKAGCSWRPDLPVPVPKWMDSLGLDQPFSPPPMSSWRVMGWAMT